MLLGAGAKHLWRAGRCEGPAGLALTVGTPGMAPDRMPDCKCHRWRQHTGERKGVSACPFYPFVCLCVCVYVPILLGCQSACMRVCLCTYTYVYVVYMVHTCVLFR